MSIFRFQQFSVNQENAGMKVCTDATLFGAMMPIRRGDRVLDIGSGTGLLSLMAAQLGAAEVSALELTQEGFEMSLLNFSNSPWAEHMTARHQSLQAFTAISEEQFDLVVCNPPFFQAHSQSRDPLRNLARHNNTLPYPELIDGAEKLLAPEGMLTLLLPIHAVSLVVRLANEAGLWLNTLTDIRGFDHLQPKVSTLCFSRFQNAFVRRCLTIYQTVNKYSVESRRYLSPFLLRFEQAGESPAQLG